MRRSQKNMRALLNGFGHIMSTRVGLFLILLGSYMSKENLAVAKAPLSNISIAICYSKNPPLNKPF
jgi:hypothetical protein